ncbi:hypothetical protein FGO68_gene9710 [Halteria grandinella]|uniref:Protein artemis n=1 Tax=Halteria grandinella TaxID=5974 RepID=A0A8J8NE23_HALGN|nr:hypothetical protein FGO68_gene9710 [Halteria grandinella]
MQRQREIERRGGSEKIEIPMITVLHTGDFRYKESMLQHLLETNEEGMEKYIKIDRLYLDNTFATSAEDFPPQEEAFDKLFTLIETKRKEFQDMLEKESETNSAKSNKKAKRELKFNLYCYTLGKEEIFHSLARNFDTKIMMMKDRVTKLEGIGMMNERFVTRDDWLKEGKQGRCFIAVKTMRDLPNSAEECEKKKDTIFVVLTGWKNQYNVKHPRFFKIPYSSHSSPTELLSFVKALQPGKLIFTVPNHGQMDRPRHNFQMKLLSYTQAGKDLILHTDAVVSQQKLSFKKSETSVTQDEQELIVMKKRKFFEIDDCLDLPMEELKDEAVQDPVLQLKGIPALFEKAKTTVVTTTEKQLVMTKKLKHEETSRGKVIKAKATATTTLMKFFSVASKVSTSISPLIDKIDDSKDHLERSLESSIVQHQPLD